MNILLVDDDPRIRNLVMEYSRAENWQFSEAGDGEEAIETFMTKAYDLVLLDVMMPRLDGWGTLRRIREDSNVPVIMLTARSEEYDRLLGFELGVDYYVSKPFSPRELVARMKALLKRSGATTAASQIYETEGLKVDMTSHQAFVDGQAVALTPKEFDLLAAMSRARILQTVWGYCITCDTRTVDMHIMQLRKKLDFRQKLKSVIKVGYRLDR